MSPNPQKYWEQLDALVNNELLELLADICKDNQLPIDVKMRSASVFNNAVTQLNVAIAILKQHEGE